MEVGGCVRFGLLFWFSILFSVFGIAILAVGAIIQVVYNNGAGFVEYSFLSAPSLLMLIGAVIFIVAFFGCCGAMKENHCMIMTFSGLLLLLFLLELASGIACYMKRGELEEVLSGSFNETLVEYPNNQEIQKSWNILQHELKCCGIDGPDDWNNVGNKTIPSSCCGELPFDQNNVVRECRIEDAYKEGCKVLLLDVLKQKSLILGLIAMGIAIVQILVVGFACTLARAMRKDYQTV